MKRRQLLIGSLLGTAALAVGIKKTEPVIAAPTVIDPDPVTEKLIDSGPYHGSYDWSSEIAEARIQIAMDRMRQTPWYRSYADRKVTERLGIEVTSGYSAIVPMMWTEGMAAKAFPLKKSQT